MAKNNKKIKKEELEIRLNTKYSFYANGIETSYTENEILVEFFQQPEKKDKTIDGIRVYLLPESLKMFSKALQETIKIYEKEYEKIEVGKDWTEK